MAIYSVLYPTAFSAFSSFYGTGYLSSKDTIELLQHRLLSYYKSGCKSYPNASTGLAASIASTMAFLITGLCGFSRQEVS